MWAEVDQPDFESFCARTGEEGEAPAPGFRGKLANAIVGVPSTLDLPVMVQPRSKTTRPILRVTDGHHVFATWQARGIPWVMWLRLVGRNVRSMRTPVLHDQARRYEIDGDPPSVHKCACCGEETGYFKRSVILDHSMYAVYFGSLGARSASHEPEVGLLVSLGEWGDAADGTPADIKTRRAFYVVVRANGFRVEDAATSPWPRAELLGEGLTRESALADPMIEDLFDLVDVAMLRDQVVARRPHQRARADRRRRRARCCELDPIEAALAGTLAPSLLPA